MYFYEAKNKTPPDSANVDKSSINKLSIADSEKKLNSTTNLRVSFYNNIPLPSSSGFINPPIYNASIDNENKLIIINTYSNTDIVADLRDSINNKDIIATALIKKGETLSLDKLPSRKVNILLTDVYNSQSTTTKAITLNEQYRITPYQENSGSGKILMYRAESALIK